MRIETEDGLQLIRKPTVPSRTALLLNEEPIHNRLEKFLRKFTLVVKKITWLTL